MSNIDTYRPSEHLFRDIRFRISETGATNYIDNVSLQFNFPSTYFGTIFFVYQKQGQTSTLKNSTLLDFQNTYFVTFVFVYTTAKACIRCGQAVRHLTVTWLQRHAYGVVMTVTLMLKVSFSSAQYIYIYILHLFYVTALVRAHQNRDIKFCVLLQDSIQDSTWGMGFVWEARGLSWVAMVVLLFLLRVAVSPRPPRTAAAALTVPP